jgi:hypothetical protein
MATQVGAWLKIDVPFPGTLFSFTVVLWSVKRQEIIALSMTEAEYAAATHAAREALWLRSAYPCFLTLRSHARCHNPFILYIPYVLSRAHPFIPLISARVFSYSWFSYYSATA